MGVPEVRRGVLVALVARQWLPACLVLGKSITQCSLWAHDSTATVQGGPGILTNRMLCTRGTLQKCLRTRKCGARLLSAAGHDTQALQQVLSSWIKQTERIPAWWGYTGNNRSAWQKQECSSPGLKFYIRKPSLSRRELQEPQVHVHLPSPHPLSKSSQSPSRWGPALYRASLSSSGGWSPQVYWTGTCLLSLIPHLL